MMEFEMGCIIASRNLEISAEIIQRMNHFNVDMKDFLKMRVDSFISRRGCIPNRLDITNRDVCAIPIEEVLRVQSLFFDILNGR